MRFLGVDLAWGFRRPSWVCTLVAEGKEFQWQGFSFFVTLEEWEEYLLSLPPPLIVAFDAPLRVSVTYGIRRAEKELLPWLRRRGYGILPINREIALRFYPTLLPFWESVERLLTVGLDFSLPRRYAVEVFPPLSVLGFFGKEGLHLYKEGEFRVLGEYFGSPLSPFIIQSLSECLRAGLEGRGYKDRFDAFLCACTALFAYTRGREALRIFGDEGEGIILPLWSREL